MRKVTTKLNVMLPRKTIDDKKVYINLNNYRNWHHQISNQAKHQFCEDLRPQLEGKKFKTPISITFTLYKASKRKTDRANILSIIEKFFCDAIVYYECIEDDNDDFISSTHYYSNGVDKENPRCEIEIKENNKKLNKLILNYMAKTKQLSPEQRELVEQIFSDSIQALAFDNKLTKKLSAVLIEKHINNTMQVLDETFMQTQAFEELRAEKKNK